MKTYKTFEVRLAGIDIAGDEYYFEAFTRDKEEVKDLNKSLTPGDKLKVIITKSAKI